MRTRVLATIVTVLLLALLLSGCAEVTLTNNFYQSSVVQTIEIVITEDDASLYGYSREDILNIIAKIFEDYGRKVERDGNRIVGTITFSSRSELAANAVGYGYTASAPATVLEGFFFDKYVSICESRFSNTEDWTLVQSLLDTYFPEVASFDAQALDYVYKYGTVYDSLKANGEYSKQGSLNVYSWNIESDTTLVFEQNRENAAMWYVLVICLGVVAVTALSICAVCKKKLPKKNKEI